MNTRTFLPKLALVLGLFAAVQVAPAHAITAKEFLALPERKQPDLITDTVNSLAEKLRSETDGRGQRKAPDLLQKQKAFARFMIALFDERDSTGAPVAYLKMDSLIYSASLDEKQSNLSVERILLTYVSECYEKKQDADATKAAKRETTTAQK